VALISQCEDTHLHGLATGKPGEGGVLDLELGVGEIASGLGRAAAVVFRGNDFLGEAEELERGFDLTREIGNFTTRPIPLSGRR